MEKTIKLSEVIKWITFIILIVSTFLINHNKINTLRKETVKQAFEIETIKSTQIEQGEAVASMNKKLSLIQSDITIIKNAVIVINK